MAGTHLHLRGNLGAVASHSVQPLLPLSQLPLCRIPSIIASAKWHLDSRNVPGNPQVFIAGYFILKLISLFIGAFRSAYVEVAARQPRRYLPIMLLSCRGNKWRALAERARVCRLDASTQEAALMASHQPPRDVGKCRATAPL